MARKMVLSNLVKNSISAYFAALEMHNKPRIPYRYEITTILLTNAWELILKAFMHKYIKKHSIFEKDKEGHTISLSTTLSHVTEFINADGPKKFEAIKENIILMEEYRNKAIHYYCGKIEPYVFMIIARASLNYVDFIKENFDKDIMATEQLFILSLGFKLPFNPEDYLSSNVAEYECSVTSKEFIEKIIKVTTDLKDAGIEDSVVLGFNIYMESIKKSTNSDLIVAISADAANSIALNRTVRLTTDGNAQGVRISEDDLLDQFPLEYFDVVNLCKDRYSDFVRNTHFYQILETIKGNPNLSRQRLLNPNNPKSGNKWFYSNAVFDELSNHYTQNA